MSIGQPSS